MKTFFKFFKGLLIPIGLLFFIFPATPALATCFVVPEWPTDNLIQNPWLGVAGGPLDFTDWDTNWNGSSNKTSTPAPWSGPEGGHNFQWAENDPVGVTAYASQIMSANPNNRKLKFGFYFVVHTMDLAQVTIYGRNSAGAPWTEVWVPFSISVTSQMTPNSPWHPCSGSPESAWRYYSEPNAYQTETTLAAGYNEYKLEYTALHNGINNAGVKTTGFYFTALSTEQGVSPAPISGGLLTNPGFEYNGLHWNGIPSGLNQFATANHVVTTPVHTGFKAYQMTAITPSNITYPITVTPNTNYTASTWVKTDNLTANATLKVEWWPVGYGTARVNPLRIDTVGAVTGTTDWTQLTSQLTSPIGATTAVLKFEVPSGTGTAWFDDAFLGIPPVIPQPPCPLPGDTLNPTCDGTININDFTFLTSVFGQANPGADLQPDGIVNALDYVILSNNYP